MTWLDGVKPDASATQYLVVSQRPRGLLDDVSPKNLLLKIGDIGGGMILCHHRSRSEAHKTSHIRPSET